VGILEFCEAGVNQSIFSDATPQLIMSRSADSGWKWGWRGLGYTSKKCSRLWQQAIEGRLMHWSIQLVYPPAAKCSLESSPLIADFDPVQPHYQMREENLIDGGSHAQCCNSSIGFCQHLAMQEFCFLVGFVVDHLIRI
jgi:hypothetical protein